MQEPQRYNLLSVLQKGLKCGQKKIYLHRLIYIASYNSVNPHDSRMFSILIESNIRILNEEYCEDILTGFGLFYAGYFINLVEGPEEGIVKHLKTLMNTFNRDLKAPKVDKMKILLVSHHINKRYYLTWNGRQATPPLLLEKIEPTTSVEINTRHIQNCIMKIYKIAEYLKGQTPSLLRATMDNISDLCRGLLPEVNLLNFLLETPALLDVKDYIKMFDSVPDYTPYHEKVWPLPSDFVPYDLLNEGTQKSIMSGQDVSVKTQRLRDENFKEDYYAVSEIDL